jgi:hypothetical protein
MDSKADRLFFPAAVIAVCASLLVLLATAGGIGLSPDAVAYVAARSLLAGSGYTLPYGALQPEPITQFPPGYPLLLAGSSAPFGSDPLLAARWLQAGLLALTVLLVAYGLRYCMRQGAAPAVLGAFLVLVSPVLLSVYTMAWSEAAFLVMGGVALFWLGRHLETPRFSTLAAVALFTGAACLVRMAGVALLLTVGLAILLWRPGRWTVRLGEAVGAALIAALPLAVWMAGAWGVESTAAGRGLAVHPPGREQLLQGLSTVAGWLHVPPAMPGSVKLAAVGIGVGLVVWAFYTHKRETLPAFIRVLALFSCVYPAFMLLSISLFDANTPLDNRILAPVYLAGLLLIMLAAQQAWMAKTPWLLRGGLGALVALLLVGGALTTFRYAGDAYRNGLGYSSRALHHSDLVAQMRALPETQVIVSNRPEGVYILSGRPVLGLPKPVNRMTQRVNDSYAAELQAVKQVLAESNGVLVYLNTADPNSTAQAAALQAELDLAPVYSGPDGAILAPASTRLSKADSSK